MTAATPRRQAAPAQAGALAWRRINVAIASGALLAFMIAACTADGGDATPDAGVDTNDDVADAIPDTDTTTDASPDTTTDASTDGGGDASTDGGGDPDADSGDDSCAEPDACGGCSGSDVAIGEPCGACDSGTWGCDEDGGLVCADDLGDDARNDCGGCDLLPEVVDAPCGACGISRWTCDGPDGVVCADDRNDCGGCATLAGAPGDACAGCEDVGGGCSWVCGEDDDTVTCEPLPAPPLPEFISVAAGTFVMGSPTDEVGRTPSDRERQHTVTLTRDFLFQTTEVTNEQWRYLMGTDRTAYPDCGPDCPVDSVSWWEALMFANALSVAEGLPPCFTLTRCFDTGVQFTCDAVTVNAPDGNPYNCVGYRLPMEAEWEYAARAGTTGATWIGELTARDCTDTTLPAIAWFCGNANDGPRPIGLKPLSPNGLADIYGNVSEWTWDVDLGALPDEPVTDPLRSSGALNRIVRGGAWISTAEQLRAAARRNLSPMVRLHFVGFRLARTVHTP